MHTHTCDVAVRVSGADYRSTNEARMTFVPRETAPAGSNQRVPKTTWFDTHEQLAGWHRQS